MTEKVTRLPCATYRTDIPASLRSIADSIEQGETPAPECLVMITCSEDGRVEAFSQGVRADDDVYGIGLLEIGKKIILANGDIESNQ